MFDPSNVGKKGTIFGLPYSIEESALVFLPVHLDTTVSYGEGTAQAPDLILEASTQLDLSLLHVKDPWKLQMGMEERFVSKDKNSIHRGRAKNVIKALEGGRPIDEKEVDYVNEFCESVHNLIEMESLAFLNDHKMVGIVGGDHSSPFGLLKALSKKKSFGILQIDAHMDLRKAYEGFIYSHASVMYNALQLEGVTSLTQVGIRDFCEEEEHYLANSKKEINVFFDEKLFEDQMKGKSWGQICDEVMKTLPDEVYVSFDMDGLEPSLCPNTGTPVPGGLRFNEALFLLESLARTGKRIVGFDVCETGKNSLDANVAARILYRLAVLTGISNGLLSYK